MSHYLMPGSVLAHGKATELEPNCPECDFPHAPDVDCKANIEALHREAMAKLPEDQQRLVRQMSKDLEPHIKRRLSPKQKELKEEADRMARFYNEGRDGDGPDF